MGQGESLNFLKKNQLFILLFLGLLVGLTYVLVVPPWMHYDEPGHFEYAWLIANQDGLPKEDDYDQYMRRQVVASMQEHRFEEYTGVSRGITSIYEPVKLLISQLGDQPLYYFLVSLPLRLVRHTDITFQLYISRLVSLMMFLATIWIAWQVAKLLFGSEHPASWMLPASLIAIPGFVDLMTAVNNDVLAIMAFSAFIWASLLLLLRGFSPRRLLFLIFSVLLCYFAKSTAWLAIPISLLVLVFSVVRGHRQKFVWIGLAILLVAAIFLSIDWNKSVPLHFVATGQQQLLLRVPDDRAPAGKFVLQHSGKNFHQFITKEGQKQIEGKTVILFAWIWADQEIDIKPPVIGRLDMGNVVLSDKTIHITTKPTHYTLIIDIPTGDYVYWLTFFGKAGTAVYWDDITLIAELPAEQTGSNNQKFVNVLRNSSIEQGYPKLVGQFDRLIAKTGINVSYSQFIELFDYESSGWYLRTLSVFLFKTFWGYFGWGAVPLLGKYAYEGVFALTILISLVSLFFIAKKFKTLPKTTIMIFLIIVILQLFMVFARGAGSWYSQRYYPTARYFYPVILPVGIFFVFGVQQLLSIIQPGSKIDNPQNAPTWHVQDIAYLVAVFLMIAWGIVSIYTYYI